MFTSACYRPGHIVRLAARLLYYVICVSLTRFLAVFLYGFVLLVGSSLVWLFFCSELAWANYPARLISLIRKVYFFLLLSSSSFFFFKKGLRPKVALPKVATA